MYGVDKISSRKSLISRRIEEIRGELGRAPRVVAIGLGRSNLALLDGIDKGSISGLALLQSKEDADSLRLLRKRAEGLGAPLCAPSDGDLCLASPSVQRERMPIKSAYVTSDAELFFDYPCGRVFGVTGSAGKSTVTTLASMLTGAQAVGNVGVPFACHSGGDAVAELSSFMLKYSEPTTYRAAITNLSENHLDWHGDMEDYINSKLRILNKTSGAVLCYDDPYLRSLADKIRPFAVYSVTHSYSEISLPHCEVLTVEEGYIKRGGRRIASTEGFADTRPHALSNMLCALCLTLDEEGAKSVEEVGRSFSGLPHRGVRRVSAEGICFVDSSIDTTPQRMALTLSGFDGGVRLLLGGRGKGLLIEPYIPLIKQRCAMVGVYGECVGEFLPPLERAQIPCAGFADFRSAFEYLADGASHGDTVLLSPAATSYGEFRSFEERGDRFMRLAFGEGFGD